ncbi:EKC/KEOPS complex subunit Pcc1 [Tanacetum coccineum]
MHTFTGRRSLGSSLSTSGYSLEVGVGSVYVHLPHTPLRRDWICDLGFFVDQCRQLRVVGKCTRMDSSSAVAAPWEFTCDLEVDYKSEEKANIIYSSLAVDKELQPDKVRRVMSVVDGKLSVHFEAVEARFLRASYSAFVDVLTLATKTIEQFSEGLELQHQNA